MLAWLVLFALTDKSTRLPVGSPMSSPVGLLINWFARRPSRKPSLRLDLSLVLDFFVSALQLAAHLCDPCDQRPQLVF